VKEKQPKVILIAGYYGFENVGDEAILSAILADLRRQRKDLDFIVISSNPERTQVEHGVRAVNWKDIKGMVTVARESDLIILGGGGIFQDYWGVPENAQLTQFHWGISYYSSVAMLATLFEKPLMIYSVGVGPLLTDEGKRLTRLTFELADAATVRDPESLALLKSLGIPAKKVQVKPDPGLSLTPKAKDASDIFTSAGVDLHELPVLGVCLRNWTDGENSTAWKQELAATLDHFLETYNAQVAFIPFQIVEHELENDHAVALEVMDLMTVKERVHAIPVTYPPDVTAGLISRCRALVGMRLHSLVFASGAGVPAVALAYDPKVHNFMRSLGMSEYVQDLPGIDVTELISKLETVWVHCKVIQAALIERTEYIQQQAHENVTLALKLLDGEIVHQETAVGKASLRELLVQQTLNLVGRDKHTEELNAHIESLLAQVASLTEQAAIDRHSIDYLTWQVAYERQLKDEITSSRVYKVALLLRKLRVWLLPPGGFRERLFKRLYRTPRELLGRIREAVRRHGLIKAILRGIAIIGIRLAYPIRKMLFKQRFEREMTQLEQAIAAHEGFFDIFHVPMGWNTLLFQRFQHVSLQVAKMGGFALYGGHPTVDKDVFVYKEVKKSLFVFKATDPTVTNRVLAALEKRTADQTVVLRIQSIDLVTTAEDVQSFLRRGFQVVYEYIDEISPEITGNVPDLVHRRHEGILKDERVIVVATSDQLFEEVQRHRTRNCILSTNGVDVDHWRIPKGDPPADLKPALTGRTIVGYHGALAKWTDYDLLRRIADDGNYELVLIGHEHDDELPKSGLKEHPRVHFLGSKSYFELNAYAVWYDIAILPFRKTDLTQAVSPVKIFEYMAARKPIVSTDLRECRKYQSCLIAETHEEFMTQLRHAVDLAANETYLGILDREAEANSWYEKTHQILRLAGVKA
jgi:polysaccharide pyruvyl transferase CsaB